MITADDLSKVPLFEALDHADLELLAQKAADVRVESGDWVAREGEEPRFFLVLEGVLQVLKEVFGQRRDLVRCGPGEFFGHIPLLLGSSDLISVLAESHCRLARFDRQQLQEIIRDFPKAGAEIFRNMWERLSKLPHHVSETPISRVSLKGATYDVECQKIRKFLSANRVPYDWIDVGSEPGHASDRVPHKQPSSVAVVDGRDHLTSPTVRGIAQALGLHISPKLDRYDIVIVGAGPAGLAAGVYGASVERWAAGGQAGTSSRIENYLGFPSGVSGDDLAERALKQASHFGAEIVLTRSVEAIAPTENGYMVEVDEGQKIEAQAILLSTGADWHRLAGTTARTRHTVWRFSQRSTVGQRKAVVHRGRRKFRWSGSCLFRSLRGRGHYPRARCRALCKYVEVPDRSDGGKEQHPHKSPYRTSCRRW